MKQELSENVLFAIDLYKIFKSNGIKTAFIAPGFRCAPFIKALEYVDDFKSIGHFDERSLAYASLSWNRVHPNNLSVLICTSGSALSHFYPALLEGYKQGVPLIIISADRPSRLVLGNDNQTLSQENFYGDFCVKSINIPNLDFLYLNLVSWTIAQFQKKGSIHINVALDSPIIYCNNEKKNITDNVTLSNYTIVKAFPEISVKSKTLLLIGSLPPFKIEIEKLKHFLKSIQIPFFLDIGSQMKGLCHSDWLIENLKEYEKETIDNIIILGSSFISKILESVKAKTIYHWDTEKDFSQLIHLSGEIVRVQQDPWDFIVAPNLTGLLPKPHIRPNVQNHHLLPEWIYKHCKNNDEINLFLGNSKTCRLFDQAYGAFSDWMGHIYLNRGHSGIEGLIASAIGIYQAFGCEKKVVGVIGDISFLYDVNALHMLTTLNKSQFKLVIYNNFQGGIFNQLEYTHPLMTTDHTVDIEKIVNGFGLRYQRVLKSSSCMLWDSEVDVWEWRELN